MLDHLLYPTITVQEMQHVNLVLYTVSFVIVITL